MLNILKNLHTVFQRNYNILHSYQHARVQVSPHHLQHYFFPGCFFFKFLIKAIIKGVRWYLIVVLICISLMSNNVEHLFMCLLKHMYFFFGKMPFQVLAHFKIGLLVTVVDFRCFEIQQMLTVQEPTQVSGEYKDEWGSGSCATYHCGPLCVGKCRWIAHSRQSAE